MLKKWLKKIGIIFIELALIAGALWYIADKKGIKNIEQLAPTLQQKISEFEKEKPFPSLKQPVNKKFTWTFKEEQYSLDLQLDSAVYSYYQAEPKKFSYATELPPNWEDEYYGMFLKINENDQAISKLAANLESLGKTHKLNGDQIVDLVLAFVQAIEYDDAKAENILNQTGRETMLRPYELLFEQKGVCSDKSLLAIAILRKMGYGTAIFTYPDQNHMAIGIQCPQNYSTYGSGYCYAETTAVGNRIGIIPSIDTESNKTVVAEELPNFDSKQLQIINLRELGQVTILQKSLGREYAGIVETRKISDEIDSLKKITQSLLLKLQSQKKLIAAEEEKLENLRADLEIQQNNQNVEKYNALVKKYNDLLETYKKDVKKYNEDAALYNKSIKRYNILIKQ